MKLVRDRIGDVPWPEVYHGEPCGDAMKVHLGWVDPHSPQYADLLRDKVREELAELLAADERGDAEAVLDEGADLYTAILAILVRNGHRTARRALDRTFERKLVRRGGFFEGRTYDGPVRADHPHALESVHQES